MGARIKDSLNSQGSKRICKDQLKSFMGKQQALATNQLTELALA